MKINVRKVFFVTIGLFIVTILCICTQLGMVKASKIDGTKFEDWVVSCNSAEGVKEEDKNLNEKNHVCILSQVINIKKEGKEEPIALFQIGYFGSKKELKMVQILPLGVKLQSGTSLISKNKMIAFGKYVTCLPGGCQALMPISESNLKAMFSGENFIGFINFDGKQVNLPLSVKGMEKGLKYIR